MKYLKLLNFCKFNYVRIDFTQRNSKHLRYEIVISIYAAQIL